LCHEAYGGERSTASRPTRFSDDRVTEVLSDSETRFAWDHWKESSLVGDTYVLRSERGYNFIPQRAFATPSDEQRFRKLLAEHLAASFDH